MGYLLKRHWCDLVCVQLSQSHSHSHTSVPPMWEHILCAQLLLKREVQVLPLREPTILLVRILVQEQVPEPDTLTQLTAISCIINTVTLFFRFSLSGTPTVTFCSAHIHNVVAKKRDASTELYPQLVTCSRIHSFQHLVIRFCGDLVRWKSSTVSALGSSSCLSAHMSEWRVDSHGCCKFDNAALGLGPRDQSAHLPVFLHLRHHQSAWPL